MSTNTNIQRSARLRGVNIHVPMSELLNTDGFAGKLIVVREHGDDDARTVQIEDILPADPRVSPVGTFDLLCLDSHDLVVVLEGLFVHQIEDMLVGECHADCPDCSAFNRKEG